MKGRTGIAIIALVSLLISCVLVSVGSYPGDGYIRVDSRSEVMQPTFCLYRDSYFQKRLDIGTIIVRKAKRSSEEKKRLELDVLLESDVLFGGKELQEVWHLRYKSSGFFLLNFIKRLLGLSASPVSCLTYGEVPLGYEEEMRAVPLEPEEIYSVWMEEHNSPRHPGDLKFIIRLDGTGVPKQLEYLPEAHIFKNTPYYLRLY